MDCGSARQTERGASADSVEGLRPHGRGPKVRAAVLTATLAELADVGYAALTIDTRETSVDEACAVLVARLTSEGYLVDGA